MYFLFFRRKSEDMDDNGENISSQRQRMMEVDSEEEVDILDMGEMNGHDATTSEDDQLLMRFCPHDSSMLYPKVNMKAATVVLLL